jgi:O-antigen/teichoic acid export membrane protein
VNVITWAAVPLVSGRPGWLDMAAGPLRHCRRRKDTRPLNAMHDGTQNRVTYSDRMPTDAPTGSGLRRAIALMSASSILIPVAGVMVQPVLARALGAAGRGELAAAIAPATLAASVALLGLPDALTYLTAKHPQITRRALAWSAMLTGSLGVLCLMVVMAALPFLSAGDLQLGKLILVAMACAIPLFVVGTLRGAALGHQMFSMVALERLISTLLRIVLFVGFWLLGALTPLVAVVLTYAPSYIAALVYIPMIMRRHPESSPWSLAQTFRPLISYGTRLWFGSVASMLLGRMSQLLMVPLSSVRELGLYTVAITVSDLPFVVVMAIAAALHGVNSKSADPRQVATATRVTLLLGATGCLLLAASVPLWLDPLFGSAFEPAVIPTILMLAASVIAIPGSIASAGLASSGRPGLRSTGYVLALGVNVSTFVLLVPTYGVYGACWAGILTNLVLSGFMIGACVRVMSLPARDFIAPTRSDVVMLYRQLIAVAQGAARFTPGRSGRARRWQEASPLPQPDDA